MTKKNIIIIRNAYSYDFGGGERFPVFLANVLKSIDYIPTIISRSPKLLAFAQDNGIKTISGWWWSRQNWSGKYVLLFPIYLIWQIILTFWYLLVFIREKPEIIHIQSKDDFVAATWAGKMLSKRVLWTDHADLKHIWKNIGIWYKNPIGKLVYGAARISDAITTVSNSELQLVSSNLSKNSPIRKKLNVVYNGITDVSINHKSKKNDKELVFCTVSRLVTDKGIKEIITAFEMLSKEHTDSRLVIVGDGPEQDRFKTMAKNNNRIVFKGYQSEPIKFMAESDVYLHATYHEGFSVSLVEASMMSLPIIATNVGGNVEIIKDKETGLLIPAKDIETLYVAMNLLYKNRELRNKLSKNAHNQYLSRFQFDKIVKEKFIPLYKEGKR